jgi:cellulose synthase/poly-beta-1,6-N-acetylglucosamine synthase-like glycosyltransferase
MSSHNACTNRALPSCRYPRCTEPDASRPRLGKFLLGAALAFFLVVNSNTGWADTDGLNEAKSAMAAGKYYDAQLSLQDWLRLHRKNVEARLLLAQAFLAQQKYPAALLHYDLLLRRSPHNGLFLLGKGQTLLASGQPVTALPLLQQARAQLPDNIQTWQLEMQALSMLGQEQQQKELLQQARVKFPQAQWPASVALAPLKIAVPQAAPPAVTPPSPSAEITPRSRAASAEPQIAKPQTVEPRTAEPRTAEPRTADTRQELAADPEVASAQGTGFTGKSFWLTLVQIGEWIFIIYFICLNSGYLALNLLSMVSLSRLMQARVMDVLPQVYSGLEPPISLLVPAYNEQKTIVTSVHAMLQLSYSQYEIIVINDGSTDDTIGVLQREFSLVPFPEAYRSRLPTKPVRTIYRSTVYPNVRVIDKENGGKADSLNVGINTSRYPLFCAVDADSILQRDSLQRVAQPFLEDPTVIAAGGTIRLANGCQVSGGFLEKIGLPKSKLAMIQIVEYLRAFLFGRMGWSPLNAMLIISGAFGLFRKESVIKAGGYLAGTIGEDMELVVRLHKLYRLAGRPYRIVFVPDPICWTEAPENLKTLKVQRIRWQHGLSDSLGLHLNLLFHRKGGAVGWFAFPFMLIFEWFAPVIEVLGYIFMIVFFILGIIPNEIMWIFLMVSIGFGLLLSVSGLLLEEMSFHIFPRTRHLVWLLFAVVIENFGYRQLTSIWRLMGLLRWMTGSKAKWGEMKRKANWHKPGEKPPFEVPGSAADPAQRATLQLQN